MNLVPKHFGLSVILAFVSVWLNLSPAFASSDVTIHPPSQFGQK